MKDIFLSHASEDKSSIARPLSLALQEHGFSIWFDEQELNLGNSLIQELDKGLKHAQFGLVILSHNFLKKDWPKDELKTLVKLKRKILPVWHEVTADDISKHLPELEDLIGAPTNLGLDQVLIRITKAIRIARNEPTDNWLRFGDDGWPLELSISKWLHDSNPELKKPNIAWPPQIMEILSHLDKKREILDLAVPIKSRPEWYNLDGHELRKFDIDFLLEIPLRSRNLMKLVCDRIFYIAIGLEKYGSGYDISIRPIKNLLFLFIRHLRTELESASSALEPSDYCYTSLVDDIRCLVRRGNKELASTQTQYYHKPALRIWGPRSYIEETIKSEDNWYLLPPELFEEFFVPQIELRLLLNLNNKKIEYSANRELWKLSSFKDELGNHISIHQLK